MSEIKGNKKIVGKINAKTLRATANVPDWLQPLIKENGVYVGTEEPTDPEKLVWINPDGQASDLDLSNYYTKDETDSLIDTAVQNIDLSSYATKVELENYDTSEQVDAKINAIQIPEIDLSDYAKKSDIPDVSGYALKTEIPTKAEQINYKASTSANYFEIPGTLQEAINIIDDSLTSNTTNINAVIKKLSDYALKTEIPEGIQHITITDATELLNLENGLYIVDGEFTVETISYQQQSFGGLMSVNWHSYIFINYGATLLYNDGDATWDCIYLAFRSEIPDVSRFITEIPSEYVTETELNAKGYLTEHQSLEGYAKTTDIPDVSGFALKSEIPSVEGLATETYVQEKIAAIPEVDLSGYALKSEIPTVPTKTSDLTNDSGFITSADIPEVDLSNYALKTEIPDVSAYQTQEQVIALIAEYGGGGGSLPASEEVGF